MPAILAALGAFLSSWFARFLGEQTAKYFIWKALLWTLVVLIFPTILYGLLVKILGELYSAYTSVATNHGLTNGTFTLQLVGLAGWIATQLKLPESFSVVLSAAMFRMAINMVPFVGKA